MDGAGHNDTYVGVNLPFPNPDAIQEFNLQTTNMSAEFGNGTSVVSIVTKSGTNQLHGDIFEFLRNGDLNARNFFAPKHDTLNRNQFGGILGGPIRQDHLFFFGTYQGTRNDTAAAGAVSFVPTAAERNGDLSAIAKQLTDPTTHAPCPNNQIPLSQITGPSQYFMKYLPLPNGPNGQLTYLGPHDNSDDEQFMTKVDYNRGKNQISGRYFFTRYSLPPDESSVLQDSAGNEIRTARESGVQTLALNHTYTASAVSAIQHVVRMGLAGGRLACPAILRMRRSPIRRPESRLRAERAAFPRRSKPTGGERILQPRERPSRNFQSRRLANPGNRHARKERS